MNPYELAARETAKLFDTDLAQTIEIKRIKSEEDIVTGEVKELYSTRGEIRAINLPASKGTIQSFDNRYYEDMIAGRVRFFKVAADSAAFELDSGDIGMIDGDEWECIGSTPVKPAGTTILFNAGFRRR